MTPRKDIFDLLRDSQNNLERSPSPAAWQRLENRLTERKRPRRIVPRVYYMAAAVLLLVAITMTISYTVDSPASDEYSATSLAEATPHDLEDITVEATNSPEAIRIREAIVYSHRLYEGMQALPIDRATGTVAPREELLN